MKTPTVHEFLKSQGIDLDTAEDVAFTSTGIDGIRSPVSAIGTMDAYAKEYHASHSNVVTEKEFEVKRLKNGYGHSHLVVITEPAIEDIHIGTVVIVPYAEGFKDPCRVLLQTNSQGMPLRMNEKFAIVLKYIYE